MKITRGIDEDLEWLRAAVRQYDWYLRDERNPRAVKILTEARDRFARLVSRLDPVDTYTR